MSAKTRERTLRAALIVGASISCGCSAQRPAFSSRAETATECDGRKRELVAFVAALPARSVAVPTRVKLARSTLGGVPGTGSLLEITADAARLDGKALAPGRELEARARQLGERLAAAPAGSILYVAPAADVDVKTLRAYLVELPESFELRLLVRSPAAGPARNPAAETEAGQELAERLLLESDPAERRALAEQGYETFADCRALQDGVSALPRGDEHERWPALQSALKTTLSQCDCKTLDTASLRLLISAEQRAGAAALAWLPISFLRDERCGASMPLRSMQKLVRQMEEFDAEFAGGWQKDLLRFDDVVTGDRFGVQFCDALPGETLAARLSSRTILYLRIPGSEGCEALRFEPIAKGSPLGTWRRVSESRPPLVFHYAQAAEEIRIYGPVDPAVRTTPADSRAWPCDETFRLTGVDKDSIELEDGRWFYTRAACERARAVSLRAGCVAASLAASGAAKASASSPRSVDGGP